MSVLRSNLATLESACDELSAHFLHTAQQQGSKIGDLIGAIQTALIYLDADNPMLARVRLARALQENKL